uniref:Claudin n=1 Tax=Scophthalmus maximus TaxID=52904 RepID=A0A8D3D5V7_SCOMX
MFQEIVAFMLTTSGWVLVSSTLPTDYWKVSSLDGTVITTATYWSNLWKTCVTDSTGVSNCKDFPSMLALHGQLLIFVEFGMKCTKIGGTDKNKARIACFAGVDFILSGLCSLSACSLYAHRITSEFFDPMFIAQNCSLYRLGRFCPLYHWRKHALFLHRRFLRQKVCMSKTYYICIIQSKHFIKILLCV